MKPNLGDSWLERLPKISQNRNCSFLDGEETAFRFITGIKVKEGIATILLWPVSKTSNIELKHRHKDLKIIKYNFKFLHIEWKNHPAGNIQHVGISFSHKIKIAVFSYFEISISSDNEVAVLYHCTLTIVFYCWDRLTHKQAIEI